jgi:hypothetical protein
LKSTDRLILRVSSAVGYGMPFRETSVLELAKLQGDGGTGDDSPQIAQVIPISSNKNLGVSLAGYRPVTETPLTSNDSSRDSIMLFQFFKRAGGPIISWKLSFRHSSFSFLVIRGQRNLAPQTRLCVVQI